MYTKKKKSNKNEDGTNTFVSVRLYIYTVYSR